MKIAIADDYQNAVSGLDCFAKLAGHDVQVYNDTIKDVDGLAERFKDAEALVLIRERTRMSAELIERLPALKLIAQTGRAGNHIDLAACTRRGIAVTGGSGSPYAPAEMTWALILAAMRRVPLEDRRMREGRWQTTLGIGLRGRTLGIYGYGNIGALVAKVGIAFGMNVLAWGRTGSLDRARQDGIAVARDKAQLFAESDVLSLHLRLVPETRGIVSHSDLAMMKRSAVLVNVSRAELVERGALEAALHMGRPGYAAVDVYEEEPVVAGWHPLLTMENTVCTPHLGYVEKDSYEKYFGDAFDNIVAFAADRPVNVVNPEVLQAR